MLILLVLVISSTWCGGYSLETNSSNNVHKNTLRNSNQYYAQLRKIGGSFNFCGAAIISKTCLITSASCVWKNEKYNILVGSTEFRSGEVHEIANVTVHPQFNPKTFDNDIAILYMRRPLIFSKRINKIRLPIKLKTSSHAKLSGFKKGLSGKYKWKTSNVTVLNTQQCESDFGQKMNNATFFTTCNTDCKIYQNILGQPLEQNGVLIGITTPTMKCTNSNSSMVFLSIVHFRNFIRQKLRLLRMMQSPLCETFKIVGGKKTYINTVPYQASLKMAGSKISFCGGTIISKKHILTAAHCLQEKGKYRVLVGSDCLGHGTEYEVAKIKSHEKYRFYSKVSDIGLIWLKNRLKLSPSVKLLALPSQNVKYKPGDRGLVSGFGSTMSNVKLPTITLRSVRVPLIDINRCRKLVQLVPNTICASCKKGGCDSCQGDSGGPFMLRSAIIGIVSYGKGCGIPGHPGVYTEVKKYVGWIKNITNNFKN